MATKYNYSDILQSMYGNGNVRLAKRIRSATLDASLCKTYTKSDDAISFAKNGNVNDLYFIAPIAWTSVLDSIKIKFSVATGAAEDLAFDLVSFGATGVPSDKSEEAHVGNLTELKTLVTNFTPTASTAAFSAFELLPGKAAGKTLYELTVASDDEKTAFKNFEKTANGFLALKLKTKTTKMAIEPTIYVEITYAKGAPSGMPLSAIGV